MRLRGVLRVGVMSCCDCIDYGEMNDMKMGMERNVGKNGVVGVCGS